MHRNKHFDVTRKVLLASPERAKGERMRLRGRRGGRTVTVCGRKGRVGGGREQREMGKARMGRGARGVGRGCALGGGGRGPERGR